MEFSSAGNSRYQSEFKIESRVWLLVCFCSVGCRTKNIKRSMITYRYSPCTHCVQSKHSPEEPGQDTSGNVFLINHCPLSWQNSSGWECRVPFPVCGVTDDAEIPTKEEMAVCSLPKRAPRPVAQMTFNLELSTRSSFCFSGQSNTSPPWQSQLEQKEQ